MKTSALSMAACLLLHAACVQSTDPIDGSDDDGDDGDDGNGGGGGGGGGGDDQGDLEVPEEGFQIRSPDLSIGPGVEVTYCYYTTVSNEALAGVERWESRMTAGSHHMILYLADELPMPEGTLDDSGSCGFVSGDLSTVWSFAAQDPEMEVAYPAGVGMTLQPRQPVIMQMHYLNASDHDLDAHVTVNAHTYPDGTSYDELHAYVTYNDQIRIDPGQDGTAGGSCAVPEGARFLGLSTHSHQFTTRVTVTDDSEMLVDTTDWDHPAITTWNDAPYYQFSGNLNYRCDYHNTSLATVQDGDSAQTDEMCMAIGYFVGGGGPVACLNSLAVPL